ncbi:TetR family transcriptional regulator [Microvirga sp. W0021]|uniref:TetR family transcriptional regulator n=1 Tax=Hohaiivirga grylli TaxID=3133970 RepID=A0ABV0BEQ5_9HYPH
MQASPRKEALRNNVVQAAEALVSADGLGALKARDIASRAGCSLGAIYTVFKDIDALILAVNERTLMQLADQLSTFEVQQKADKVDGERWLVGLSHVYLNFAARSKMLWLALFEHRMSVGSELPQEMAEKHQMLFDFIEQPLAILKIGKSPEERQLLARSLFSAVHGMVVLGLEKKLASLSLEALKEQIEEIVSAAVRGLVTR